MDDKCPHPLAITYNVISSANMFFPHQIVKTYKENITTHLEVVFTGRFRWAQVKFRKTRFFWEFCRFAFSRLCTAARRPPVEETSRWFTMLLVSVSMSRKMSLLDVALFVIALLCKSSFSLNLTCGDAWCVRDKLNASDSQNEDLTTRSPYHIRRSVGKLTSTQDPINAKWLFFV